MNENREGTGRDSFEVFGEEKNENGTRSDSKMRTLRVGGAGRGGTGHRVYSLSTGRDGKIQRGNFSRRDGTVQYNGFVFATGRDNKIQWICVFHQER